MAFSCIKPFGRDKQMRNTLIPILVAICLFITGVAILNIWICPYISRHLLSLNPLQARCRRYSRGER
ncbi:hypothetical protein FCX69_15840 [Escherichia coli]|nr:hypothetical protein [Escherichia coli]